MSDHNYLYFDDIQDNDVILILGATKGDFMRETVHKILEKRAFIINVEPTLEGIESLSSFIKRYLPNNATILSCAVSDYIGSSNMEIRDNLITSTLSERPETNQRWPMKLMYNYTVPVLDLDTILNMFPSVTKIFCDIEGSELEVFGGSKLLEKVPYIAVASYHLRDGVPTHEIMKPWFEKLGYFVTVTGDASQHNKHEVVLFAKGK